MAAFILKVCCVQCVERQYFYFSANEEQSEKDSSEEKSLVSEASRNLKRRRMRSCRGGHEVPKVNYLT